MKLRSIDWGNSYGIWMHAIAAYTLTIRVAVDMKIPLMIWGEHGRKYIAGMYSYDYIEFTYRYRHEHANRGYEWYDM